MPHGEKELKNLGQVYRVDLNNWKAYEIVDVIIQVLQTVIGFVSMIAGWLQVSQ